jgi:chromosome segregation ATPase
MNKTTSSDTQYTQIQQTHYKGCWVDPKHHACALVEIERLRGEVERLEDVLDGDDKAISDQEAEIDQFKQMVKDAAQALNDEERENDRLRELLREAIDKPFTLGRQSTIDAWQVVWSRRVREALGDE